jgi:hypothetical protein
MNRMMKLCAVAIAALGVAAPAGAHTLTVDCFNVKGQVVACQGGFSDGTVAAGAEFTLYSEESVKLGSGTTDEHGVVLFKAPDIDYIVVIGVGPAHVSSLASPDISATPHRPGWGGDWIPVVAVDRLEKLQQWRDQFLGETPPLIQKAEEELAK